MDTSLFADQTQIGVRALFIGQRLDLKSLEQAHRMATAPLVIRAGARGCAVLFRYGVVVLFSMTAIEEVAFLADLRPLLVDPFDQPESEEVDLVCDPENPEGILRSQIHLQSFSVDRLQLAADVLAKSVVLSHYESSLAASFDRIEPLAAALQRGKGTSQGRELLRHIGDSLMIHGKMVGRVEVQEKPELLWERPELERLYLRLEDEYELHERQVALERKLELISRTAETMLGLVQNRQTLRVEWYIVILIVAEILLTLYELFVRHT